jgi:hypothetical protein
MKHSPLPDPAMMTKLFKGILNCELSVTKAATTPQLDQANATTYAGLYLSGRHVMTTVIFDVPLVAASSAALAATPAEQAAEWVAAGRVDDESVENAREVFSVMASTLNESNPSTHVKLGFFLPPGQALPAATNVYFGPTARRMDYAVDIEGYGGGVFTVLAV